jgi:hypothetical protein
MQPFFTSTGTIEDAIDDCYSKGGRVCGHQDLAFACSKRDALGLNFPDNTWLLTGDVSIRSIGNSTNTFVGYVTYRRSGTLCFGPATVNPTNAVLNYDLSTTVRNYTCCAERSF